ncbi:hypothetical protein A4V12_20895 [Streptomyces noursei]|nr:hypothetical protein A4V12_20895 [Streptomyces noursei]
MSAIVGRFTRHPLGLSWFFVPHRLYRPPPGGLPSARGPCPGPGPARDAPRADGGRARREAGVPRGSAAVRAVLNCRSRKGG